MVIEAKKFHQADDKFVVEDLEVLEIFDKSFDAYDEYRSLHQQHPSKEFLFANTEMPILEIPTTPMDGIQSLIHFELRNKLPFISITAVHNGIKFTIDHVLVDTGSSATIFASDYLRKFGIDSEPEDKVRKIVGVGGPKWS